MKKYDVVVIGGGPAGMGAAVESAKVGAKTLIIERDCRLGGILNQCIHNGFGLHYFKEELTGPEYADRFVKLVKKEGNIDVLLNTFVTKVEGKNITIVNEKGCQILHPKAIVYAMGCREKTAGSIKLNGSRPAGIMTAGQVQKMVNFYGKMPGKKVVILGSGDIGLIMARRLTFAGAKVEMVCEVMSTSSGLPRNITQCLNDFNIPIYYNTTISEIVGKDRVKGVKIAKVDETFKPIPSTEKFVECDLVVLSVGLAPEYDIVDNPKVNPITNSFYVNEYRECEEGVFACGNVLQVHDLVDNVTAESSFAGRYAGLYALNNLPRTKEYKVLNGNGVRYVIPNSYYLASGELDVSFRVQKKFGTSEIIVESDKKQVYTKTVIALKPSELVTIKLDKSLLSNDITISIKEKI